MKGTDYSSKKRGRLLEWERKKSYRLCVKKGYLNLNKKWERLLEKDMLLNAFHWCTQATAKISTLRSKINSVEFRWQLHSGRSANMTDWWCKFCNFGGFHSIHKFNCPQNFPSRFSWVNNWNLYNIIIIIAEWKKWGDQFRIIRQDSRPGAQITLFSSSDVYFLLVRSEIAKILLQNGGSLDVLCSYPGQQMYQFGHKHKPCEVEYLCSSAANELISPLMLAIVQHNFELTRELIKLGASLNFADVEGRTPLMVATLEVCRFHTDLLPYINVLAVQIIMWFYLCWLLHACVMFN